MSVIRKIIGFIPALLPIFFLYLLNIPWTETEALSDLPFTFPWYLALWIAASLLSGVLLCSKKLILPGLITGVLPYAVMLFIFYNEHIEIKLFLISFILFYIVYGIIYYTYHREADKP